MMISRNEMMVTDFILTSENALSPLIFQPPEKLRYLFFPLLLLAVWKWNIKWVAPAIFTVFVMSLLLAEAINFKYADAAFYLLPTRAWE